MDAECLYGRQREAEDLDHGTLEAMIVDLP